MQKYWVKICCISSVEEAELAIQNGASAIGLVGPMPSGPGIIDNELIAAITKTIPTDIETFLLTSETDPEAIIHHYKKVNTSTIQLVDSLQKGSHAMIRKALPDVKLVQVIHVLNDQSIEEAKQLSPEVDYILLDSGNPNLAIKELGGTGRVHNWDLSREIVDSVDIPIILAGGLNPNNVANAIENVKPYGVDLCSGVRTDKKLDREKLSAFFDAVRS